MRVCHGVWPFPFLIHNLLNCVYLVYKYSVNYMSVYKLSTVKVLAVRSLWIKVPGGGPLLEMRKLVVAVL